MGNLEDLLDASYSTTFLADMLRAEGEKPVPSLKPERVRRVAELVQQGVIDFDRDIITGTGVTADVLDSMCQAVGLERDGRKDELRRRLSDWYARTYARGRAAAPTKDKNAQRVDAHQGRPGSSNVPRGIAIPAAEREFIEVLPSTEKRGLLDAVGLGVFGRAADVLADAANTLASAPDAPKVLAIRSSELDGFTFDDGVATIGTVYARHPIDPQRYIRAEDASDRIAREKLLAILEIAGLLGASRVELMLDEASGSSQAIGAEIAVLGRELGLDVALSERGRMAGKWEMSWPNARRRPRPIPAGQQPYLRAIPELGALARMVEAEVTPERLHYDVRLEFEESQKLAAKLKKIPKLGTASGSAERQAFVKSRWTVRVWFPEPESEMRPAVSQAVPRAMSQPSVPVPELPGAPCPACHAALVWIAQYQRWYCAHCQRYAAT